MTETQKDKRKTGYLVKKSDRTAISLWTKNCTLHPPPQISGQIRKEEPHKSSLVLSVLLRLSNSAYPVLPVQFLLFCSACPILPVLQCLSCSVCPILAVLFWLSCPSCPVLAFLFWGGGLSCPSCLSLLDKKMHVCKSTKWQNNQCSKTMLTGESWFHKSTPWGLNPGPSWREANGWTTGPAECSEIAGSTQGSSPAPDYVSCEARSRTCSEHETGTEELYEIK